jgi:siroheme synthase-like protein
VSAGSEALRFLPVGLDLRGHRCVVVGGGVIGTRKALTLASCGADVTVVAPQVTSALADAVAAGTVRHLAARFEAGHLARAFLVVAATDDDGLNEAVAAAAAEVGALVCDASSAGRSQLTFGAMLRRDDATVAVFTDGRDPAHARRTRDRIAGFLDRSGASRDGTSSGESGAVEPPHDGTGGDPAENRDLLRSLVRSDGGTLLMMGVSLGGGMCSGRGPALLRSAPPAFAQVKKSHRALHAFLDRVREATPVREAMVWNTCQRVELYAWIPGQGGPWARRRLEEELRRGLFDGEPPGLHVGVLHGAEAYHHLLRTVCGLNSDLPGDRDVAAQLETARHSAECAGIAGPRIRALVMDAVTTAMEVNEHTAWGGFSTGYCAAAMTRVFELGELRPTELRYVVVGGSTTSRAVLSALRAEHLVPERQLTVVYRDHHGQMKELRSAVGSGRRLRVHEYREEQVLRAAAAADVVIFGIDQPEPVWDAVTLLGLRDFTAHPLTVVDFNSSGSIGLDGRMTAEGVHTWSAKELDRAVAAHVAIATTSRGFSEAVAEAEGWIEKHLVALHAPEGGRDANGGRPEPAERTV